MRSYSVSARTFLLLIVGFAASLGMLAGILVTLALQPAAPDAARWPYELPLYATASDTGANVAMATGPIDENMEGVFFLDFATGELAAVVINSLRPKMVGGVLKANVAHDIGAAADKKPAYLMVTGAANFTVPKVGAAQMGKCVVYVLDQNSGVFVGYGFEWNPLAAKAPKFQEGALVPLIKNKIGAVEAE